MFLIKRLFSFAFEMVKMEYSDKQKQIILSAERLFSEKGYEGTSVRDIADEAGVNLAMISYYFGSKDKLMEALFEQRTTNIKSKVENLLLDEHKTPLEKIESLADDYINRIIDKHLFFKIWICEEVVNKNPVILKLINDLKKRNADEIGKLIKDGQQKHVFKENIDVLLMMNTLIGTITQTMITIDYYREYYDLNKISDVKFYQKIKQKLRNHIRILFKALLSYEA